MKYRIAKFIARAAPPKPEHAHVHFHLDSDGQPFVCDTARCESPALSHAEVPAQYGSRGDEVGA